MVRVKDKRLRADPGIRIWSVFPDVDIDLFPRLMQAAGVHGGSEPSESICDHFFNRRPQDGNAVHPLLNGGLSVQTDHGDMSCGVAEGGCEVEPRSCPVIEKNGGGGSGLGGRKSFVGQQSRFERGSAGENLGKT